MTLTPADVRATDFPAASRLRRGYAADEVDGFLERIAVRLETGDGLTSNDVYHVPLAKARIGERGYVESDVDAFLDRVHGELSALEESWSHANLRETDVPAGGTTTAEVAPASEAASTDEVPTGDAPTDSDGAPDGDGPATAAAR